EIYYIRLLSFLNVKFIANSKDISNLFFDNVKIKADIVIPPFMNASELNKKLSAKSKDKKNKKIFFTLTRLVERKNIKNVIYALSKINTIDFVYYIAGSGPCLDSLKKTINELGLEEKIQLLGRVSEEQKENLLLNTDLFILPSLFDIKDGSIEGYGIVYIEANAFGIPVISGNTGGITEAVIDGKTGFHSDGSVESIYNSILKAIDHDFDGEYIITHALKHDYSVQSELLHTLGIK
ncbi:glycosyltransferase, partial [Photobacterium angustum]